MKEKTDRPIRIAALRIQNILGIVQAEIRPGKVTLVEGANGLGKTSILESFRAVLSGGHDATLLRKGADVGEIVMLLDDGQEISKRITADDSKVTVTHPEFGRVSKPRTIIEKLCDAFALNPVDFLVAKKETRLQLLLSAIPLKLNPRDVAGIASLCSSRPNFEQHAMIALSSIEKDLYDQRTGVNRVAKEKRTTATEMAKALPPEASGDESPSGELQAARQALRAFLAKCAINDQAVDETAGKEKWQANDEARGQEIALRGERDQRIEQIRVEYEAKIQAVTERLAAKREEIEKVAAATHASLAEGRLKKEQILTKNVADAEARAETYTRTETTRAHLAELTDSASRFEQKSQQLTNALGELEEIRSALLEDLPIKGVEICDGEIIVDDIPFDRLNESKRVRLAIDVAMLRAGNLPVLCVDGIERLDTKSIQALEEFAAESDVQLVLARVTDGELQVRTIA